VRAVSPGIRERIYDVVVVGGAGVAVAIEARKVGREVPFRKKIRRQARSRARPFD
jgi:succinate dehydrogenase/fumarate reductase flavoprotein subunit